MELILWRHAEAVEADGTIADHKRRLTPRGERQARQVARWLHRHLPKRYRILVSPAERTQQTVHALELPYEIEPGLALGAAAKDVLKIAGWPDQGGTVLVVGHQPTLGRVASAVLAGREAEWSVKKGGLWWFSCREREGQRQTVLRAVLNPDFL